MSARSTHLSQNRIVTSRVPMGIVVCGNFASFEIVAEPGNGLCLGDMRNGGGIWTGRALQCGGGSVL